VWADNGGTGDYAVRISGSRIQTFKNWKEHKVIKPPGAASNIWGGAMLVVAGNQVRQSSGGVCGALAVVRK
jgi:hypothetical protein